MKKEYNEEAALAEHLWPITLLLPLFSISPLLFPHSLSSSPTFSISALNIQVLSTATDP